MCQLNNILLCFEFCFQFFDSNNFDFFLQLHLQTIITLNEKKSFLVKKNLVLCN